MPIKFFAQSFSVLDVNLVRSDCHLCVCGEERVQNNPAKHAAVVLLHKHVPANMDKEGVTK
jgi:hypothetical protein